MATHRGRRAASTSRATSTSKAEPKRSKADHDYASLRSCVHMSFLNGTVPGEPLFKVALWPHAGTQPESDLWEIYHRGIPDVWEAQMHNCHACRSFIRRFGGLVTIDKDSGALRSAMWQEAPEFYRPAIAAMRDAVERAAVVGPFLSRETVWGTPQTGAWEHFWVAPPADILFRGKALTPGQAMAAARENHKTVLRALAEFTPAMLDQAIKLFEAEALDRPEKFLGPLRWLRALHDRPKGRAGDNVLWRAIVTAPEGYCHPRASVLGPLLAAIEAGSGFDYIKRTFESMTHGLRYALAPRGWPMKQPVIMSPALVAIGADGVPRLAVDIFQVMVDGELVTWKVSAIRGAALAGMFGPPEDFPLSAMGSVDPQAYEKGNLSRERIEQIKADPTLLDEPCFAIEAPPPNETSLLGFVDGQHRVLARIELGKETVRVYVVPWHLDRKFRIEAT